jgi:hypothetical protein
VQGNASTSTSPRAEASAGRNAPNPSPERSSAYTIPLLCAGVAIIACCLLIPASDQNRRLTYEREGLKRDLDQIKKQIAVNDEFLNRVASDSNLLERLAQRQMNLVREGTSVLELNHRGEKEEISPFMLVTLPPPEPLQPYHSIGGVFAELCREPRSRLMLLGAGMLLAACGLVMGASDPRE